MNWKTLAFVALVGFGLYQYVQQRSADPGPGAVAPEIPLQQDTQAGAFTYKNFSMQPLADFSIEARVLSSEHYRLDREAKLSPVDLALGWGRMSDSKVLEHIHISQSGRSYFWSTSDFPIPRQEIEQSSANMHMIPADDAIDRRLRAVRIGQVVRIRGWLVQARSSDGWVWRSSLTRSDTGPGSCELVFVRDLEVL